MNIKKVFIIGVAAILITACNQTKTSDKKEVTEVTEQSPINQEKKKDLNENFEFDKLSMKVSSEWRKKEVREVSVFILNDETSSHIQIEKEQLSEEVKDSLNFTQAKALVYFSLDKGDLRERKIANQDVRGYDGRIIGSSATFGGVTYYVPIEKTLYRFTILTETQTSDEDLVLFERFLDTVKIK